MPALVENALSLYLAAVARATDGGVSLGLEDGQPHPLVMDSNGCLYIRDVNITNMLDFIKSYTMPLLRGHTVGEQHTQDDATEGIVDFTDPIHTLYIWHDGTEPKTFGLFEAEAEVESATLVVPPEGYLVNIADSPAYYEYQIVRIEIPSGVTSCFLESRM